MKKSKIMFSVMLALCLSILPLCLAGCRSVVPVAYVHYVIQDEQFVQYTAHVSGAYPHIIVYDNETKVPDPNDYAQPADYYRACESSCSMYFSFKRNMGKDTIANKDVLTCDIQSWYYMEVVIKKDSGLYSPDKKVYVNGVALTKKGSYDTVTESEYTIIYHFENFGLKRGNPNGQLNNVVNTLEYK